MEQIIKLEKKDDITAIRNRIDFILPTLTQQSVRNTGKPEKIRLLVIVPRRNKTLHNLVNMKLLARMTHSRAVEMAVVSSSPAVRDNARAAGVKAFGAIWHAKITRWIKSKPPVAKADETLPPVGSTSSEEVPETSKKKKSAQDSRKRVQKKKYEVVAGDSRPGATKLIIRQLGVLILITFLALGLVMGAVVLLPEATVTLTPVAQAVETDLIVKADPNVDSVDFQGLIFPARIDVVELELFGAIETVETELAPVGLARGSVVFINRTAEQQTIPLSTTVSTSAGQPVEFSLVQTITIPAGVGATSAPTLVIATESGPAGNVSTGQINRFSNPAFERIARVINEQPTNGGRLEPAKIIVENDKERLVAHLRQLVQQEGLKLLEDQLGEQEFISPQSVIVFVQEVQFQEFSGDFSDTFGGEMQAVVQATVIGGYNANRLALAGLEAQVPSGYKLNLEGLNFGAGEILDIQDGVVIFRILANGQAVPVIDGTEVAEDIAWLPVGEAQALLNQQYALVTVPGVELKPDWLVNLVGRLPFVPIRIDVVINDAVTLMAEGG